MRSKQNRKLNMNKIVAVTAFALVCASTAMAQKQGELMVRKQQSSPLDLQTQPAAKVGKTNVKLGKSTVNSNLKSRGFVGPYEIVAHRERGLFGPSTVETFIFDNRDGSIAVVNPSSSPGVGIAAVNGGALVGASYLFGHSLRPDQSQISNGSSSSANGNGGSAVATGGAGGHGGVANSNGGNSSSSATGGTSNATGGSSSSSSSSSNSGQAGGSFTPPGLVNNPGHSPHSHP